MRVGGDNPSSRVVWGRVWRRAGELRLPRLDGLVVAYKEKARRYRTPSHVHRAMAELYYVDRGRVKVTTPEGSFTLGQQQYALLPPGMRHAMAGDPAAPPTVLVINFIVPGLLQVIPEMRKAAGRPLSASPEALRHLDDLCAWSRRGGDLDSRRAAAGLQAFLLVLAAEASMMTPGVTGSIAGAGSPLTVLVEGFMRDHFRERLTLGRIARAAGCSVSLLVRDYRRLTGRTVHSFLVGCRMEHARGLLRMPGNSVKTAAFASGFSSQAVFSRAFKRAEGMTPLAFRKSLGGARP